MGRRVLFPFLLSLAILVAAPVAAQEAARWRKGSSSL
jgi:hypothetical protein